VLNGLYSITLGGALSSELKTLVVGKACALQLTLGLLTDLLAARRTAGSLPEPEVRPCVDSRRRGGWPRASEASPSSQVCTSPKIKKKLASVALCGRLFPIRASSGFTSSSGPELVALVLLSGAATIIGLCAISGALRGSRDGRRMPGQCRPAVPGHWVNPSPRRPHVYSVSLGAAVD
jgi:hypothetical protein